MKKIVLPVMAVFLAAGAASAMDGMNMKPESKINAYVASPSEMVDAAGSYSVDADLQRLEGVKTEGEAIRAYIALPEEMVDAAGSYNVENDLRRFKLKEPVRGGDINFYVASPEEMVDASGSYNVENDLKRFGIE